MSTMLRAVEAAAEVDLNRKVRDVARVLLVWHHMTQLELGRRLGLADTPIRNRLQGRTPFTVSEIGQMAAIFDMPPEAFLAGPSALLRSGTDRTTLRKPEQQQRAPHRTARPARPPLALVAAA